MKYMICCRCQCLKAFVYTAVSGSTWTLAQYLSSLTDASSEKLLSHLCTHSHTHVVNIGNFLSLINSSRHNAKAIMEGIVQRYNQQNGSVSLVDIFGMLLGAVLLTKKDTKTIEKADDDEKSQASKEDGNVSTTSVEVDIMLSGKEQKISKQQRYIKDGSRPMPIYCVVRHAIREDHAVTDNEQSGKLLKENDDDKNADDEKAEDKKDKDRKPDTNQDKIDDEKSTSDVADQESKDPVEKHISQERDIYQWFELTPFEVGSEELSGKQRLSMKLRGKCNEVTDFKV